jgi:hypothetical protein
MSQFPFLPPKDDELPPGHINLQEILGTIRQAEEIARKERELQGLPPVAQLSPRRRRSSPRRSVPKNRKIYQGPRGGQYYIKNKKKVYI